ncbi:hypothetical protein FRC09_013625 [Ceratobasidium sp. 395]|nr:hypothetical protein FRC09_013625 [Ceratobasidium sp. 395]
MVRYLAAASIFVASTTIVRGADDNSTITAKFEKANTTVVPAIAKVPQLVWSVLNSVVGGRLYTNGAPFSRPCFANGTAAGSANVNACAAVQSNYLSNVYRADNFGAYINTQWETCQKTQANCYLDYTNPANAAAFTPPMSCAQGSVSSYYIDVRNSVDVIAAFVFSRMTSVPLVIKNSGRPERARALDTQHQIHFASLYSFAEEHNITVLGGTDKTVGAAGGWVQGGGHGILSNTLGLGVDRVLQFKLVTPDGILRTANACQNSDLFWALRGGGGGTFGVVLEATSRVEPRKIPTQAVFVKFNPVTAHVVAYMSAIIANSVKWAEDGWGGYVSPNYAIFATPKLNRTEAEASMAPLTQIVASFGSDVIKNEFSSYDSFLPLFNFVVANAAAPVGRPFTMATRIIPASNFATANSRNALLSATLAAFSTVGGAAQIMVTAPYSYNATSASDVSATPAWRNALWHTLLVGFWNFNSTAEQQAAVYGTVSSAADRLRAITPGSGAYQNEADVSEPDHENSFWGSNYPRLVSIKKKYDPKGLLDCWHCVNWQGANNERYQCYTQSG